jgi:fucose 4-O-acetylase-like acetyltransferase
MDRITWVDVYKGIAIILVVVGHSTGLFNPYIYQFHMAAFFFISGYTSNLKDKGLIQTAISKLYTIYLPYVSFFLITLTILSSLHMMNFYDVFFKNPFLGFTNSFAEFLNNRVYINILGATWFLISLFGICILQKILFYVCGNKTNVFYVLLTLFVFLYGYLLVKYNANSGNYWHSVFIGQFYFALGYVAMDKKFFYKLRNTLLVNCTMIVLSSFLLYYFAWFWPNTVDYPSKRFGNIFGNAMAACNGILLLYAISRIIEDIKDIKLKSILIKIGKSTLGVVFLHFLMFKVSFCLLVLIGVGDKNLISELTPPRIIGDSYWWIISIVSVYLSVKIWEFILKNSIVKVIMGQDKNTLNDFFKTKGSLIITVDRFLESIRDKMFINISKIFYNRDIKLLIYLFLFVNLSIYPMLIQGVICNDELQSYLMSLAGWSHFSTQWLENWVRMGRILGAPLNIVSNYCGFLSKDMFLSKTLSIAYMLFGFFLFSFLVWRLLRSTLMAVFLFVSLIVFLPINFEHVLPNAFVALFSIPLILALLSFHFFLSWLQCNKPAYIIIASFLWFIFLTGYEAFVALTVCFIIIVIYYKNYHLKDVLRAIGECRYIIGITFLFLLLYCIGRILFPSTYDGNSIAPFSISNSLKVVMQLIKSGLPGYFIFNEKYQYLFEIYYKVFEINLGSELTHLSGSLHSLLDSKNFKFLLHSQEFLFYLRISSISILGILLIHRSISLDYSTNVFLTGRRVVLLLLMLSFVAILLAIPNSLGKMYQDSVNSKQFIALPVSFVIYCIIIFSCVIIIFQTNKKIHNKVLRLLVFSIGYVLMLAIQVMNGVFSHEQALNFERIKKIESFLDTNQIKMLHGEKLFAPDFYQTKNLLAIHDGYWSQYMKNRGLEINISAKHQGQNYEIRVLTGGEFLLLSRSELVFFSPRLADGGTISIMNTNSRQTMTHKLSNGTSDNKFIKYIIPINNEYKISDSSLLEILFMDHHSRISSKLLILDWGPRETTEGTKFNIQPNGFSAMWVKVNGVSNHPSTHVNFGGTEICGNDLSVQHDRVTFNVNDKIISKKGTYEVYIIENHGADKTFIGDFIVR